MLDARDHRNLAARLDLFHFDESAPGMALWHPHGWSICRVLEDAARQVLAAHAYLEVRTPQIVRRPVWEASGHWEHFSAGMFRLEDQSQAAGLKPVSCPGHVQIAKQRTLSYRDLPLRLAEFGIVHRDEPSGTLHGLMRLRQFTQDDGHIFCEAEQAPAEIERFCRAVAPFYAAFGFDRVSIGLSTRPAARFGEDSMWDEAEHTLAAVLERVGLAFTLQPGEGAFYGPKLEFVLEDRSGRRWQCGTIQYDFSMPQRFGLHYAARDGGRVAPVMLHRALYGSLERFLGIVLEHHGAPLPAWLAPVQVRVLPVAGGHLDAARHLLNALSVAGLRADLDAASESLGRRMVRAREAAAPFLAVLGDREVGTGTVALGRPGEPPVTLATGEAVARLRVDCAPPPFVDRHSAA